MSPRRSSRARATQPPPAPPTHTNSSTSSTSSSRAERSTRSKDKASPQRRSYPRSQSIDDFDDSSRPLRRTRSGAEEIKEPKANTPEDEEDEEEVTRCICGQTEYPGLPTPTHELLKQKAKEPGATYTLDAISDDLGGLFIQCDICKVWQHGGCVSILDDASVPEEYFCEQCRRDLHKVSNSPSGQRYSNYLPLKEESSPPASPQPASRERSKRTTDSKGRQTHEPKRRATLNSREIYNEAEALQRAIEESKKEGLVGSDGQRKKRSRSDSEDRKDSNKRPRTGKSNSPDPDKGILSSSSSDEALASKLAVDHTPKKNVRGAAVRNHQAKEQRDQKERERQDAVAKRKSRAERRHGDESPSIDSSNLPPASNVSTPPTMDAPSQPRSSHRKTTNNRIPVSSIPAPTKPPPRRLGRNQYTKDRDSHLPPSSLSNSLDPNADLRNGISSSGGLGRTRSRSRSNARDLGSPSAADSVTTNGLNGSERGGGIHGHMNGIVGAGAGAGAQGSEIRPSRPKHMNPNRTSMNEMKKRVAAILEFVSRAEDEGERHRPPSGSVGSSGASFKSGEEGNGGGGGGGGRSGTGEDGKGIENGLEALANVKLEADFGAMDSGEMLRTLKARLASWEDEYGRYGTGAR